MSEVPLGSEPGRLRQLLDFARSAEPRAALSGRAIGTDIVLAAVVLAAALWAEQFLRAGMATAVLTSVPLACRRRYPMTVYLVVCAAAIATKDYATWVTFIAMIIAAYSAVVHSRFRGAALLGIVPAGLVVALVFWTAKSALRTGSGAHLVLHRSGRPGGIRGVRVLPGPAAPVAPGVGVGHLLVPTEPWRVAVLLLLASLFSIAIVGAAVHSGDRIRRLKAGHADATQRILEQERARIASELHDVVTHNVSVMIVQAGAARQVLADAPDQAREALLAVEAGGRAAMSDLRQLLGLLSPPGDAEPGGPAGEPQPGLARLGDLIGRVTAAGVPVELRTDGLPADLPPGVDLAAFRIVQEALTNVIKHAGRPPTEVALGYAGGELIIEVTDAGAPIPEAVPAAAGAGGRGLVGLRERVALYGGELEAGPRLGGGWRVRARIPAEPVFAPGGGPR